MASLGPPGDGSQEVTPVTLVAAGILWSGYTLCWWGWSTLKGCRVGFSNLTVPGRYHGCDAPLDADKIDPDTQFKPAPGAGPTGTTPGAGGQSPTSPPSTEGYFSRVPK